MREHPCSGVAIWVVASIHEDIEEEDGAAEHLNIFAALDCLTKSIMLAVMASYMTLSRVDKCAFVLSTPIARSLAFSSNILVGTL